MMMAEALGIREASLERWRRRIERWECRQSRCGRPPVIAASARDRIRSCYQTHYGQWGPRVLAGWCRRQGLGDWSASTIACVIEDLRPERGPDRPSVRYEVTAPGVMWSEDGTGFRERGRKKELLVVQDEHARFKLQYRLVNGPADEDAVFEYLRAAFKRCGPPLVLKHDGASIFHGDRIRQLLADHQVTELTGPPGYPPYNGKNERSMRDIKSYVRAMRRASRRGSLRTCIDAAINDLNHERPRPVLGDRTARETYEEDQVPLPDRARFIRRVNRTEKKLREAARSRVERERARRKAVELVLLRYGLIQEWCDVSPN